MRDVADLTGSPEILDGRVKTLHPRLHAGLLAVRDDAGHIATLEQEGIEPIDLVCVNLYPFEQVVAGREVSESDAVENIDIGGPTMIRAAAKNHRWVAVVVRPESYDAVLAELQESGGAVSSETRHWLANEAFATIARYDAAISRWFGLRYEEFPTPLGELVRALHGALLRREPASERGALRGERHPLARALAGLEAARHGRCRSTTCSTSTRRSGCWPSSTSRRP